MLTFPNAKINLGLNVISRRPDGYHNIETVMMPVPSFDILEVVESRSGADSLHCSGRPVNCPMEKNLVYKALLKMRTRYEIPPVEIYLCKQTPDGAGLGGGSADAAFMLRLLNDLFRCGAGEEILAAMAAQLGADCPFFIHNRPMFCSGTGTDMVPFDLRLPAGSWIVLVKPGVSVPTAEAYAGLTPTEPQHSLREVLSLPADRWQGLLVNDFEPTVIGRHPVIGQIKKALLEAGAYYSSMSGSGSAVFGLFSHEVSPLDVKHLEGLGCYLIRKIS